MYKQTVHRPCLRPTDRLFWAWRSRLWPRWHEVLAFVQPRTVLAWPRQRCRDHWRRLSQQGTSGRPAIVKEVRELMRTMWQANATWGAPRIVGELRKLGLDVATSTGEKYRPRARKSLCHCQRKEKSLTRAFPLRKADSMQGAKIQGFVEERTQQWCISFCTNVEFLTLR